MDFNLTLHSLIIILILLCEPGSPNRKIHETGNLDFSPGRLHPYFP